MNRDYIREFEDRDGGAACEVIRQNLGGMAGLNDVARELLARKLNPGQFCREMRLGKGWVVEFDGVVQAVGAVLHNKVNRPFVSSNFQNQGLGTALLLHMQDEVFRAGHQLVIVDSSLQARKFYERNGFSFVEMKSLMSEAASFRFVTMSASSPCRRP
jgi:GNAT superfamily N-acetyltransferase